MALTTGTGPFSQTPAGRFDVTAPRKPLLFWEQYPKRFRVVDQGKVLADSRKAIALNQTGEMMRLCMPFSDVRREFFSAGPAVDGAQTGPIRSWALKIGERTKAGVASSFEAPPETAEPLRDYVFFDLDKVDAWYLEDDLGYAHPRDPYHRFDVHRSTHHIEVLVGDTLIAEGSAPAKLFETGMSPRIYLPPDAIRPGFLAKSDTVSKCPYKGDGQHWHIEVEGCRIADAAWNLTTPMGDALMIPRWFSFYPEKVIVKVDGQIL